MKKLSGSIMDALKKGPIVADGKLECAIAVKFGLDRKPQTYKRLVDWLQKEEEKGVLVIERSGAIMRKLELAPNPEPIPTEEEVMNESEAGPTESEETETEVAVSEQAVVDVSANDIQDSLYAQLSLALLALQTAAEPDGVLEGPSAKIIADELGISLNKANPLNTLLGKLGLRVTSGSRSTRIHRIDMTTKEITKEMVESLTTAPPETTTIEPEEVNLLTAEPALVVRSVEEQLADVIEGLEAKIRGLEKQLVDERNDYFGKAEKGAAVLKELTDLLGKADTKIGGLEQQLAALQAPSSDRVKSLLARHLPSTDTRG